MERGEHIEVYSTFTGRWTGGFVVEEVVGEPEPSGYRVRRVSEQNALPAVIDAQQVRPGDRCSGGPS